MNDFYGDFDLSKADKEANSFSAIFLIVMKYVYLRSLKRQLKVYGQERFGFV